MRISFTRGNVSHLLLSGFIYTSSIYTSTTTPSKY